MDQLQGKPMAILGAGSWGTALALYLARRGLPIRLWSNEPKEIAALLKDRSNQYYLPGFAFPDTIHPTEHLAAALDGVAEVLIVVPSVGFRHVLTTLKPLLSAHVGIICATKGLDAHTGQSLSQVVHEVIGSKQPFAILSGPSFAREVAGGLPTAVVVASTDAAFREKVIQQFNSAIFRTHASDDVIGVEMGGVVKNVIAIATGITDGLELGANARSALLTNGLDEMLKLGLALGGKQETFFGLSGLGDLILTATDNQSRNRRFGLSLGRGQNLEKAEQEIGQIVEGKRNAELLALLAARHQISMPICETVWKILQGKIAIKEAALQFIY